MNVMRFTILDSRGTISFVADCYALGALVAACADNPLTVKSLLERASCFHRRLWDYVSSGLAIFDEHNVDGHLEPIHAALQYCAPHEVPVFRVVDDVTRQASLTPVKAGVVLFNLPVKRIVQIQNSFGDIERAGRIRVHDGTRVTNEIQRYKLPSDWSLVP